MQQDPFTCWLELLSCDYDYARNIDARRIAITTLPDGKWVSTVRLPFGALLYETIVFANEDTSSDVIDVLQYDTEDDARQGYAEMEKKWS